MQVSFNTEDRDSLVCNTDAILIRVSPRNGMGPGCNPEGGQTELVRSQSHSPVSCSSPDFIGRVNRCITRYTIGIYDKDTAKVRDAN